MFQENDMSRSEEVQKLRKIAAERYHLDGGTMFECTSLDEYHALIKEHGTAEAAWAAELDGHTVREAYVAECRAAYDY
jgi:hypothetical protein